MKYNQRMKNGIDLRWDLKEQQRRYVADKTGGKQQRNTLVDRQTIKEAVRKKNNA
jgi:hypothetical protein